MYLAQSVEIRGLRTSTFEEAMARLAIVDGRFSEYLAGTDLTGSAVEASRPGGSFLASNRVFTLRSDAPTEQDNHFGEGVDPMGALARFKRADLIHAPDNIVKYFKRNRNAASE